MSVNCIVCNTLSEDNFIKVKELQLGLQEEFTYQICNNCGSAMLLNAPVDMGKYYPNEDYYSFTLKVDVKDKPDFLRSIKSSYLLFNKHKILGRLLSIGYKMPEHYEWMKYTKTKYDDAILDVGTGNGSLLVKLNEIGFTNLTGIDPFLNESKDYGNIKIHKKSIDDVVEMYDTVMLHHALEHVFEPKKVLQKVKEILKPGGSCLIRIPIMGNYGWQQYNNNWCGLDAPRHIFIPSEKGLKLMAEEAGFSQEDDNMFICGIEHIQKLLEAEREACANVCLDLAKWHSETVMAAFESAADAIKARGSND
jgi:SAM-dependent methyltransferase